ncbi:MAG: 30S ribosomal protein S3, partial [Candidatus Micrarchaeia archaeon]
AQHVKEFEIEEFVEKNLNRAGISQVRVQRTPLGEKIIIYTSRPGLVVGRSGESIRKLTKSLKKRFGLENPQIEISEVENVNLDPKIVAEKIATSLERYGINRFKGIMHKSMEDVMNAGAMGVEIVVSGKIPSSRAKSWRVYSGYLKKCGNISIENVRRAVNRAELKTGTVGIKVSIMPPGVVLPDNMKVKEEGESAQDTTSEIKQQESKSSEESSKKQEEKPAEKPKRQRKSEKKGNKKGAEE